MEKIKKKREQSESESKRRLERRVVPRKVESVDTALAA